MGGWVGGWVGGRRYMRNKVLLRIDGSVGGWVGFTYLELGDVLDDRVVHPNQPVVHADQHGSGGHGLGLGEETKDIVAVVVPTVGVQNDLAVSMGKGGWVGGWEDGGLGELLCVTSERMASSLSNPPTHPPTHPTLFLFLLTWP